MSFWDLHLLASCLLSLLIGTIYGIGFYKYPTLLTSRERRADRFILWVGFFFSQSLLHLYLDYSNPVLWIGVN